MKIDHIKNVGILCIRYAQKCLYLSIIFLASILETTNDRNTKCGLKVPERHTQIRFISSFASAKSHTPVYHTEYILNNHQQYLLYDAGG